MHTETAFKDAAAFATYRDIWAGAVPAALVPFRTKRNGGAVVRYRWKSANGCAVGGFRGAFVSAAQGVKAAERHAEFSNVRTN
jgi:hypothetical protein